MKLALLQFRGESIYQHESTAAKIEALIERACAQKPDYIVLPECAYPAYIIRPEQTIMDKALAASESVLTSIASLAKRHRVYITVGIAVERDGALRNAAVTFDRNGREINLTAKSNLWHFDDRWFVPGDGYSAFDTEFGRVGAMICADGRIPEIAALLAADGATLIVDPVNLVASAEKPELLTNQQYEFILQERAKENGLFIAACDKCGVEAGAVTFLGRSFVVGPEGEMIDQCSPDKEEIRIVEIDLSKAKHRVRLSAEHYSLMTAPSQSLPVAEICQRSYTVEELAIFTMVARFGAGSADEYLEKARRYAQSAWILRARLLILPEMAPRFRFDERALREFADSLAEGYSVLLAGTETREGSPRRTAVVLQRGAEPQPLSSIIYPGEDLPAPVKVLQLTPSIRLGAIFDEEVHIPEVSRTAMLNGADILVCFDTAQGDIYSRAIRTRAAENKIFVVRSASAQAEECSYIINPDGGKVTTTFRAVEHSAAAFINTALSKFKSVVPGTEIVTGRIPSMYRTLI